MPISRAAADLFNRPLDPVVPPAVTLAEIISELERECRCRNNVYPNLVRKGSITAETARYRIRCLEVAVKHFRTAQAALERPPIRNDG